MRVSLLGTHNFIAGLSAISAAFGKAHGSAKRFHKQLQKTKGLFLTGFAITGAGLMGLEAMKFPIEAAVEYRHELEMLKVAGVGVQQIAQAQAAAALTSQLAPTTTLAGNLQSLAELRTVLGQLRDESGKRIVEHATERAASILPQIQQMNYVLENMLDERGYVLHQGRQAYVAAKALELRGATKDMGEFVKQANMMTQAIVATRGRVRPQDFLSAVMYGRRAGYQWNDQFMYRILPTLIQEMQGYGSGGGGVRGPGNALMSAFAEVVGGVIPKKSLPYWAAAGLIGNEKIGMGYQVGSDMKKKIRGLTFSSMKGFEEFVQNANDYALHYLIPFYQKMGWIDPKNVNHILAPAKIVAYQQKLFPNRTASIMDTMVMRQFLFQRDVPLYEQAKGIAGAYGELTKNDPIALTKQVHAQFHNLLTEIGNQDLPIVNRALRGLRDHLKDLTSWAHKNPDIVKNLSLAFAGLSIAAVVIGPLIVLGGVIALIGVPAIAATLAFAGLAAGIGYLIPGLYHAGVVVLQFFRGLGHWFHQGFDTVKNTVSEGWGYITTAFTRGWANLKSSVFGFFNPILDWLKRHGMKVVEGFMSGPQGPTWNGTGKRPSRFVYSGPGADEKPIIVHVNVDSRHVATAVAPHLARGIGYASARGRHDPRASLAAAGAGYSI